MVNKIFITIIFTFIQLPGYAQNSSDLQLILSHRQNIKVVSKDASTDKRRRIVPYVFKPGFLVFKHGIYNQMGLTCIFDRPCIDFCGDLIERFGLVKGYFLSIDRIVRCNRLTPLETYPSSLSTSTKVIDSVGNYHK